ncbi:chitinase N-terminal domain-containing protein [Permianibacter aggregans]|uniref:Chitinase A-like protein n=1 Tax=Permianibacter aggregans TaxID=1510150 RepID=A0A4V3D8E8_9GAMM|nr:chitinase N-terminal domain-containing protein [Permianibacter aggregans]TDQ51317.1 chitinase A-like protein [Permianibacter aggregans]
MKKSVLSLVASMLLANASFSAPATPVITNATGMTKFSWVLIHAPVSFLVPSRTTSADGTASFQWNAVSGATYYQVRLFVNGVWSEWQSVGSNTYFNAINADGNIGFEVRACDSSGCSAGAGTTVITSAWKNLGVCDPRTNQQTQICVNSNYCTLNSQRTVSGNCGQSVDCG